MRPLDDTIVAIASPPGGAARGIVRLSGPRAVACLWSMNCSAAMPPEPTGRPTVVSLEVQLHGVFSPLPGEAYVWPQGRSYTGQLLVEFHTLGSAPLLAAVVEEAVRRGARLAEPGEFTLRAFLGGRIDLTQAEAVLGVIDADGDRQLEVALQQLAGGLATPLARLRQELLHLLADIEAGLDFAGEDIRFVSNDEITVRLEQARTEVLPMLAACSARGQTGELPRVVLCGPPNAGKSSLFNALAKDVRAIVTNEPGTTRDYLAAEMDAGGVRCLLIDTAGVESLWPLAEVPLGVAGDGDADARGAVEPPETAAARHTRRQVGNAALRVLCHDPHCDVDTLSSTATPDVDSGGAWIAVLTKCDVGGGLGDSKHCLRTSSATGEGIESLRAMIGQRLLRMQADPIDVVAGTLLRARESLVRAEAALGRALELARHHPAEELIAAELREALLEVGKVAGAVYTEDVLDRIFSRFCVGK